eukprot:TRINITY_DN759_c0_g1_i7.p1 TRINITY_DN759_c0_g1~~TRINITY_DN759_c0_g1_i7.p1  ORF type:complete len:800 (+),score=147.00 TRINITY_DN759_c0_g1_i7:54-2453(+)
MGVDDNIHPVRSTVPFPPHLREFRNERVQGPLYVCEVGTVKRSGFFKRGKEMLLVVTDSHVWLLRKGNEVERSAMLEDIEMAAVGWNILELHFYMETFYPVLPVRLASTQGVLETIRFLRSKVRGGEGLSMGWPPSKLQPVDKHLASYTTTRNSPVVPPNYPPEPCEAYGKIPFDASLNYSRTVALRRKSFLNGSEAARRRLVVTDRFLIIEKDGNVERKARLSDISRVTRVNYNTAAVIHFYPSLREPPLLLTEITINELISVLRYRRMKERNGEDLQVVELDSRSVWSNPWCPYDKYPPGYSCPKDKRQKNLLDNGSVVPPYYPPCVNLPEYVREDMHGYFTNFYSWVMIEDFTESEPHRTFLAVAPKCVLILLNAGRQTGTLSFRSGELGDIASIAKDRFGMHSISFKDESFPWLFKVAEERAGDWMDMINRLKPGGGDDLVLLETSDVLQPTPTFPSNNIKEMYGPPSIEESPVASAASFHEETTEYHLGPGEMGIFLHSNLRISGLEPGSEAAKAGVPIDGKLLAVNGRAVSDYDEARTLLAKKMGGCTLTVGIERRDDVLVQPGRLGIFLDSRNTIVRVARGSQADKAGVRVCTILEAVGGKPVRGRDHKHIQDMLVAAQKSNKPFTLSLCTNTSEPVTLKPGRHGIVCGSGNGEVIAVLPGSEGEKAGVGKGILYVVGNTLVQSKQETEEKLEELSTGKKPYSLVLLTLPRSSASESPPATFAPEPEHVPAFEHVSAPGGRAEVSGVLEVPSFNAPSPDKAVTAEPLGQPTGPGLGRARAPRRGRTLRQVSC